MQELLSKKQTRLYKHLQALSCDMSIIATDWFLCLFSTSLPAEVGFQVQVAGSAESCWNALMTLAELLL